MAAGTIMVAPERRAGFQSDSCRTASTAQVRELRSIRVSRSSALERDNGGWYGVRIDGSVQDTEYRYVTYYRPIRNITQGVVN